MRSYTVKENNIGSAVSEIIWYRSCYSYIRILGYIFCILGTSVQGDLLFELKPDHIYVMSDQKLSKVRVQDCAQYQDCGQCLGSR